MMYTMVAGRVTAKRRLLWREKKRWKDQIKGRGNNIMDRERWWKQKVKEAKRTVDKEQDKH